MMVQVRSLCLLSGLRSITFKSQWVGSNSRCSNYLLNIPYQVASSGYQRCQYIRSLESRPKLINNIQALCKVNTLFMKVEKGKVEMNVAQNLSDSSSDKSTIHTDKDKCDSSEKNGENSSKQSVFLRFKIMWKKYWYVLIPVHIATSAIWIGCFYYASVCGVDIVAITDYIGFGKSVADLVKKYPSSSHIVVAYALYKVFTPARYTVTLSGTYFAIKHLSRLGYIKPAPSKEQVKTFLIEKRRRHQDRLLKFYNKQKRYAKKPPTKNGR